jgi:lipopolysaccharide/colanic/teichoic acid biosynthesis glycosyltransferase
MDLLFTSKTFYEEAPSKRYTVRHFSAAALRPVNCQYSGFYYIGKNSAIIEKLVKLYERGYASEGLENAKNELLRSASQEQNNLPEVIICEASFESKAIRQFTQFLRMHPSFNCIPFVLEGSKLTDHGLLHYRNSTKPDEILKLHGMDEATIRRKVQFLHKVKATGGKVRTPRIEENANTHLLLAPLSKRAFDILLSLLALGVLSPIFLLIAIMIRLESRGSVIYVSKRAGRGYRVFDFYKFRTMVADAEKKMNDLTHLNQYVPDAGMAVFFKINDDPRITRVGRFLRNTSLDELPQLINVFLGHMSLVGNRPLPLYEAKELTTDDYAARFMAPAGITGLWQVKKRGNKDMSAEERISIDIMYATNCSFATDLWIIANTPTALLQKANV